MKRLHLFRYSPTHMIGSRKLISAPIILFMANLVLLVLSQRSAQASVGRLQYQASGTRRWRKLSTVKTALSMSCMLCLFYFTSALLTFHFHSRGKKIFRKFTDEEESGSAACGVDTSEAEIDAEFDAALPARLRGPLTRSSIKPRLLFPTPQQDRAKEVRSQAIEDDEEAVTDIEDPTDGLSTPKDHIDEFVETPKAPKFAPASPPTTVRATRSGKNIDLSSSPVQSTSDDEPAQSPLPRARGRAVQVSPFDRWQRTKGGVGSQSKKREGGSLTRGGAELGKRQRG